MAKKKQYEPSKRIRLRCGCGHEIWWEEREVYERYPMCPRCDTQYQPFDEKPD
jgi:hypothetical protein